MIELFSTRVAVYDLRPVNFSVLSLITHNPGITSRQLCSALSLLPPNLVDMIGAMKKANWSLGGHTRKTAAPSTCI